MSGGLCRAALVGLSVVAVAGCQQAPPPTPPPSSKPPPPGAIKAGMDFYMVPIGRDGSGCETFRPWSRYRVVAQIIYYRAASGGFTPVRADSVCGRSR